MKALIVVDFQNDFVNMDGALYVHKAEEIIAPLLQKIYNSPLMIATQDWHRPDDVSFVEQGGLWPPHCIQCSFGAKIAHRDIEDAAEMIIRKSGYSAFNDADGSSTGLHGYLRDRWVDEVEIVGLAMDFCVESTAIDAAKLGYYVSVPLSCTRAVWGYGGVRDAAYRMANAGITINN